MAQNDRWSCTAAKFNACVDAAKNATSGYASVAVVVWSGRNFLGLKEGIGGWFGSILGKLINANAKNATQSKTQSMPEALGRVL